MSSVVLYSLWPAQALDDATSHRHIACDDVTSSSCQIYWPAEGSDDATSHRHIADAFLQFPRSPRSVTAQSPLSDRYSPR